MRILAMCLLLAVRISAGAVERDVLAGLCSADLALEGFDLEALRSVAEIPGLQISQFKEALFQVPAPFRWYGHNELFNATDITDLSFYEGKIGAGYATRYDKNLGTHRVDFFVGRIEQIGNHLFIDGHPSSKLAARVGRESASEVFLLGVGIPEDQLLGKALQNARFFDVLDEQLGGIAPEDFSVLAAMFELFYRLDPAHDYRSVAAILSARSDLMKHDDSLHGAALRWPGLKRRYTRENLALMAALVQGSLSLFAWGGHPGDIGPYPRLRYSLNAFRSGLAWNRSRLGDALLPAQPEMTAPMERRLSADEFRRSALQVLATADLFKRIDSLSNLLKDAVPEIAYGLYHPRNLRDAFEIPRGSSPQIDPMTGDRITQYQITNSFSFNLEQPVGLLKVQVHYLNFTFFVRQNSEGVVLSIDPVCTHATRMHRRSNRQGMSPLSFTVTHLAVPFLRLAVPIDAQMVQPLLDLLERRR